MEPRVSFGGSNSGFQVGVNHGSILVEALDPLSELSGVPEAEYGSYKDQYEDECLPGTRTALLDEVTTWARSPHGKCIFWLNGMAGTGKSTISRTVAAIFKNSNLLGASFFFKWGEADRGNAIKFFPSLTKQLMLRYPELGDRIRSAMKVNPGITSKSLSEQFDKLLYQPLRGLAPQRPELSTAVVVIDALDECGNEQDVQTILRCLPLLRDASNLNIRIFVTSRPELPIRQAFSEISDRSFQDFVLHEMISKDSTGQDIALFLKDQFTKIRASRRLPLSWPREEDLQTLVTMSVPLFISAATLCRFIGDNKWQPTVRLAEVLNNQEKYAMKMENTYLPILERLLAGQDEEDSERLLHEFQDIIGTIVLLVEPLPVKTLAELLDIPADVISNRLESFSSVLHVLDDQDLPVRIMHLSFRDFLIRSKTKFRVDTPHRHRRIFLQCIDIMRKKLRKSLCGLGSDSTVKPKCHHPQASRQNIPLEVRYACNHWVYHLGQSEDPTAEINNVLSFLTENFFHWVEALDLVRERITRLVELSGLLVMLGVRNSETFA
ncbi:uncharacterized protein N7496_010485 [Penicillium cataractarum]|uniref:NACHT domain-containing protein n=1 Tax=Penicillium cataractarum TaxID=2100454 RepID=A0A9W9RR67_9EURO|nr:uncharacterized protein N7496_010485 [Penicillium cataractarum]KAJ5364772.1 hypothetical protein N7496_010485 [Penicillium cataractarum]